MLATASRDRFSIAARRRSTCKALLAGFAAALATTRKRSGLADTYVSHRSYGKNVEVDYRGAEVSVANFITVLTGAWVASRGCVKCCSTSVAEN